MSCPALLPETSEPHAWPSAPSSPQPRNRLPRKNMLVFGSRLTVAPLRVAERHGSLRFFAVGFAPGHTAEVATDLRDMPEVRAGALGSALRDYRIHYIVEPLVQPATQEIHALMTRGAQKHPGLCRVRPTVGIKDDGLVFLERSRHQVAEGNPLGARNVIGLERAAVANVHHPEIRPFAAYPVRQLESRDVILFPLHDLRQTRDVHACVAQPRRTRNNGESPEHQSGGSEVSLITRRDAHRSTLPPNLRSAASAARNPTSATRTTPNTTTP